MKQLGYYAKDKDGNLHQFQWGMDNDLPSESNDFYINDKDGYYISNLGHKMKAANPKDFEVLEIGFFNADSKRGDQVKPIDRELYNIILVHVARSWERIRVEQPHEEMPQDNIGSTDSIEQIATTIYEGDIIQGFINGDKDDYWLENTTEGMSDIYIETAAHNIIHKHHLGSKAYDEIYTIVHTNDTLNPNEIVKVGEVEYVVGGENFVELCEAYFYWEKFKKAGEFLEVFSRVWVTVNMDGVERRELEDGCNMIECNVIQLDFINNYGSRHKDNRDKDSIAYELWEWVKDTVSPRTDLLPFEIKWEDVNNHRDYMMIEHPKYKTTFEEILIHISLIDEMELEGRGFIEFDDNIAKQNVETVLDLMERYRGAKLI